MSVQTVLILNRSGGLVYCKDFVKHPRLKPGDWLRVSGIFYGLSEVIKQVSPQGVRRDDIQSFHDETVRVQCLHTLTGLKFIVSATPSARNLDRLLKDIYGLYADFVLKDPFHRREQPIKSGKFIQHLDSLVTRAGYA